MFLKYSIIWLQPSTRVRENRELEEETVTEFIVEQDEEVENIPEGDDDMWMLDIEEDDALLAASCDSNGEHGIH